MQLEHVASFRGGYGTRLCFAPDGVTWACARMEIIQIWKQTSLLHEINLPGQTVGPVQFADQGELLLAGPFIVTVNDGRIQPFPEFVDRLTDGVEGGPLAPWQMAVENAMFTPDAKALLVYARYHPGHGTQATPYHGPYERLLLLDGHTREPIAVLWEGDGLLNFRVLATSRKHLAAAGTGVRLWSLEPLRLVEEYPARSVQINAFEFNNDGSRFAYGDAGGNVTLRSVSNGIDRNWTADPEGVSSLCFYGHDERVLTGGRNGLLTSWALRGDLRSVVIKTFDAAVEALAVSPGANHLLVALGGARDTIELFQIVGHGAS